MTAQLRPMNLGEILDRTLQIYRSRFLVLFSIAAIPALALMAIKLADNRWFPQSQNRSADQKGMGVLWNLFRSLLHYHFAAIVALLIFPIFVKIASAAILDQETSLRAALRFALSKWRSFLWIAFLKFAAQLLIPEALTFGAILLVGGIEYATGAFDDKGAVILVALALFSPILGGVALFLWLSSCLSLAVPVVALEPLTGFKAMKRSWKLSRDARISILVAWMSLSLLAIGLAIGFHMILRGVAVYVFFHGQYSRLADQPLYRFMDYLLTAALSALTSPLYPISITLFYYDQRIRREGYDIERLMESAGMTAPLTPPHGDGIAAPAVAAPAIVEVPRP